MQSEQSEAEAILLQQGLVETVPVEVVETGPDEVVVMVVEEVTTEPVETGTDAAPVIASSTDGGLSGASVHQEQAIAIDTLLTELSAVEVHTYKIIPEGSQRHQPILVDSSGNKYNRKPIDKRGNSSKITWTCNVRRKGVCCHAKVAQIGDTFIPGLQPHTHTEVPKAKLPKPEKEEEQTSTIEKEQTTTIEKEQQQTTTIQTKPRSRQPKAVKFYMNGKHVPSDFLIADVELANARHLLFATPEQRRILKKSKTLFADVTCKLVKDPFQQILTLSAYLKDEDNVKQYAQLFVVMSRKLTSDYIAVLEKIGELIPRLKVNKVILGFDAELWEAFDIVFPDVVLQGCVFHWTEVVYLQIVNLGLNLSFTISSPVFDQVKELLALPFIPAEDIPTVFEEIVSNSDQRLLPLAEYFRVVWINNPQWPIISWCVYGMATRTKSDVEAWHDRLIPKAGINRHGRLLPKAGLNRLIGLLLEEAQSVTTEKKPVNFEKLTRHQKKCRTTKQSKLFKLWARYEGNEIMLAELLRSSYNLNNPL